MRKLRRFFSAFLLALICACLTPFPALATDEMPTVDTCGMEAFFYTATEMPLHVPLYRLDSGQVAYCLNMTMFAPGGDSYVPFAPEEVYEERILEGLLRILEMGYPYPLPFMPDLSADQAEYATAVAIWSWLFGGGSWQSYQLFSSLQPYPGYEDAYQYTAIMLDYATNGGWELSLSVTPETATFVQIDDILVGSVRVSYYGLNYYQIDHTKYPSDITIQGYTGQDGDTLEIIAPLSYLGQSLVFEDVLVGYTNRLPDRLSWYDPENPAKQSVVSIEWGPAEECIAQDIRFTLGTPTPRGRVQLIKVDADDPSIKLDQAHFVVYKANGALVEGIVTGSDGKALSSNLALGSYYLREVAPPNGYVLSTTEYPFEITMGDQVVTIQATNSKTPLPQLTGEVSIVKVDADDADTRLAGAVFGIYAAGDGTKIGEVTTDAQGSAFYNGLPFGGYYLQEITAPAGYAPSDAQYPFSLSAGSASVTMQIENSKIVNEEAQVRVIKRAADDDSIALQDAVFGIYRASDDVQVDEITTGADGSAISQPLPLACYYLKEIAAPQGYRLSAEKHPFELAQGDTIVEVEVANQAISGTGRVKLVKVDGQGKSLSGAVFGIYRANDDVTPVGWLVSGQDGTAISGELPIGAYYLLEMSAPQGYRLSAEKHHFTLTPDSTIEVRATNERLAPVIKGTLEIYYKHLRHGTELHRSYSYTDDVGTEYMPWVYKYNLDRMPIPPYSFVKADYPASTKLIDGKLIITYWYDDAASGGILPATPGGGSGGPGSSGSSDGPIRAVPKTGETFPWGMYVGAGALILCAAGTFAVIVFYRKRALGKA